MNVIAASLVADQPELAAAAPARLEGLAIGVRPEAIQIAREGLRATVVAAEYLGADTQIEARAGEETVMVRVSGRCAAGPGETVGLTWKASDAHWFDMSSGRRIDR